MHAVKGNLANTVCKRKHQHIASVPVLGGPCMLFSNFDSLFIYLIFFCNAGEGEGWRWIFFPPSHPLPPLPGVTLTQSQGEVTPATVPCASWPAELNHTVRHN